MDHDCRLQPQSVESWVMDAFPARDSSDHPLAQRQQIRACALTFCASVGFSFCNLPAAASATFFPFTSFSAPSYAATLL